MQLRVLLFLLMIGSLPSFAKVGQYTKTVQERVSWQPEAGQNGPAATVIVKITHDVFFGDPTQTHIAGKYELGSYVMYKGQRINTAALPDDVKAKIKFSSVDICYDMKAKSSGKIVSTKCAGTVLDFDMAGSPNWGQMFPGLSADQAKALYKNGYDIVNIRVTKLNYSFPNLDAYLTGTASTNPVPDQNLNWQTVGYARKGDTIFIRFSNGSIEKQVVCQTQNASQGNANNNNGSNNNGEATGPTSSKCTAPTFGLDGGPGNYCANFIWGCPTVYNSINGTEFKQIGLSYNYVLFEYRKEGDQLWKSEKVAGCPLVRHALFNLEPCTRYEVRMRASCTDGSMSEYSNILRFETACTAPGRISFPNITSTSADISYLVSAGACYRTGYETIIVEYTTSGMQWKEVELKGGGKLKLEPLLPGTTYRVRLKTRYANGKESKYSTEAMVTTRKQ